MLCLTSEAALMCRKNYGESKSTLVILKCMFQEATVGTKAVYENK